MGGYLLASGKRCRAGEPSLIFQIPDEGVELGRSCLVARLRAGGSSLGQGARRGILDLQNSLALGVVRTGTEVPHAAGRRCNQDDEEQHELGGTESAQAGHDALPGSWGYVLCTRSDRVSPGSW